MKIPHLVAMFGLGTLLTACPFGDPAEAFGPGVVISLCGTSKVNFETPTACRVFTAADVTAQGTDRSYVTVVLPDETSMKDYFTTQGVTEEQFIASTQLIPFVRKHLLLGLPIPGTSQPSLAGTNCAIDGTRPSVTICGKTARELATVSEYTFVRLTGTF
jgi:hypothetical protein